MKCYNCGKDTIGINILNSGVTEYIPDMCESCIIKISESVLNEEDPDAFLECPKCQKKVPILRKSECIGCYEERCNAVLKLPLFINDRNPIGGYQDIGQEFRIDLKFLTVHKETREC